MSSLVDNMPLWDKGYSIPLQELEEFDVPVLNMGPVGKRCTSMDRTSRCKTTHLKRY